MRASLRRLKTEVSDFRGTMGIFESRLLSEPLTDKHNEYGCGNGLKYAVSSMQGWRPTMEDAHRVTVGLNQYDFGWSDQQLNQQWSFFGVFDGHGGRKVSAHCAEHLMECIVDSNEFRGLDFVEAIRRGFLKLDRDLRMCKEFVNRLDHCGSTAVCAFVSPQKIYVANCGDSRAILCKSGVPAFSTQDHKPFVEKESTRISLAGGSISNKRIEGVLAVSRALGDYEYKKVKCKGSCEQLVSPEPEIFIHDRDDDQDEFLVIACDGVWDVMSNQEVCNFIRARLSRTDDLVAITNDVLDHCLYKGRSTDNMSIVLVTFPGAPSSSSAVARRRKTDDVLLTSDEMLEFCAENKITKRRCNDDDNCGILKELNRSYP